MYTDTPTLFISLGPATSAALFLNNGCSAAIWTPDAEESKLAVVQPAKGLPDGKYLVNCGRRYSVADEPAYGTTVLLTMSVSNPEG